MYVFCIICMYCMYVFCILYVCMYAYTVNNEVLGNLKISSEIQIKLIESILLYIPVAVLWDQIQYLRHFSSIRVDHH